MKRASAARKTAEISVFLHQCLSSYSLAATAAGVGVLIFAPPIEAKIVYTRTNHVIPPSHKYTLDLNHDGIADFVIKNLYGCNFDYCYDMLSAIPAAGNGVEGAKGFLGIPYAFALNRGALVGPKHPFSGQLMASDNMGYLGRWRNVTDRYLGLKFQIKEETHYGWARLTVSDVSPRITATLTGYAYETVPNKPINAGRTSGPDGDSTDDLGPGASITPMKEATRPPFLGVLALGAQGIPLWRREYYLPFLGTPGS